MIVKRGIGTWNLGLENANIFARNEEMIWTKDVNNIAFVNSKYARLLTKFDINFPIFYKYS